MASETIRVAVFVTIVGAFYCAAAAMLVGALVRRVLRLPPPGKTFKRCRCAIWSVASLGACCIAYGYFVEPYWPEVTRVQITSDKLGPAREPIRLVHISDLHCDPRPRLETRLPGIIALESPDAILFTGDSTNSPEGLPVLKQCMRELCEIAPTYVVRGNWDIWRRDIDLFGDTGAIELDGLAHEIRIRESTISIAGAAARASDRVESALAALSDSAFTIFLYHYPDVIYRAAERGVDLCCAGHTHGGQVALPFYGAIITRSKLGKRFEAGLYRVQDTWLYVNRGIGMEGKLAPRVRFCSRPEVTVIEISPR